jgi:hypothetical protein
LKFLDPTSSPETFFLQVIAVVVGGVLLIPAIAVLRWLGTPLKWWWRNWDLQELIRRRREFILVYQPNAGFSKPIKLLDNGQIGAGRNNNEDTWRVRRGCLEFLTDDGKVYSRFKLDKAASRLRGTADLDVASVWGQYLYPQY